ncbi:Alpha/beta hydrolase family protein [Xylophilus ampelinus]|nr:alpha/beta fold hydrolase [Variovorax sp.]VTY37397.1 Alpha/beta hydrolase family protein [Xylophilus ampelinus]
MNTTTAVPHAAASGFYGANPWVRALRLGLGASQRLWPALGVHVAARVFGTPLPPAGLQRRHTPGPDWQHRLQAFEQGRLGLYRPAADAPLPVDAPAVLLVHGWGGHAGQMLPLATALMARGLRPVLLEMPAHGRSGGGTSNLAQFTRAIGYVAARHRHDTGAGFHAVVAHSLGANALAQAASQGLHARRLVLLAPPASPVDYTRYFAQVFGLRERTRAAMQRLIESREGIVMPQFEPAAVGARIAQPTLVVHDRADRVNAFADGEAFRDAIPGARLVATEGWGHRRILKEAVVLEAVAGFVAGD